MLYSNKGMRKGCKNLAPTKFFGNVETYYIPMYIILEREICKLNHLPSLDYIIKLLNGYDLIISFGFLHKIYGQHSSAHDFSKLLLRHYL